MTRLIVAGAGLIGARHAAHIAAHPDMELVAIVDPDPSVETFGARRFARIEDVACDADGIVIATPSHLHADHAEVAAAKGWACLIEKPVAHTRGDAARIAALSVPTLVGHHRRHHSHIAALKAALDAGWIGRAVTASLIWAVRKPDPYFQVPWRQGREGSPVMINLIHEVDLLRHLFGEVRDISALGSNAVRGAARIESGGVLIAFASGMVVSLAFADTTPSPWGFEAGTGENPNIATTGQDSWFITGTEGAISFPSLTLWQGASDWSEAPRASRLPVTPNVPLIAQLEHFCDVIAGVAQPVVSAADGARSLDATLRIEAALLPQAEAA